MPDTGTTPSAILALDVGRCEVNAHLILYGEEAYRWEGMGRARMDIAPSGFLDRKCILKALKDLSQKTGRDLISQDQELIVSTGGGKSGVDRICLTWSVPMIIKAILIGLMPGLSTQAGETLLGEYPIEVIDRFTSTDQRSMAEKIDILLTGFPDLVLLVGGTERGADLVIRDQVDLLVRAYSNQVKEFRPEIFYAGNSVLQEFVRTNIEPITILTTAANVRPAPATWDLQPARESLAQVCSRLWVNKAKPRAGSRAMALDNARPRLSALEDFTEVLALSEKTSCGTLEIDLDGLSTSITVNNRGRSFSNRAYPDAALTEPGQLPEGLDLDSILDWSANTLQRQEVIDTLVGNSLYPQRVPATERGAEVSGAIERAAGRKAWHALLGRKDFPKTTSTRWNGADVDNVLISGPQVDFWKYPGIPLLEMLDILQPVGLMTVFLDEANLAATLGTAAHIDPRIALHCTLSGAVPRLATVIAPVVHPSKPVKILSLKMALENGTESTHEFYSGDLKAIPLGYDQTASIELILHKGTSLGSRTRARTSIPVKGSRLGIIIDARGRPLVKPKKSQDQYAWLRKNLAHAMELDG